MTLIGTSTAPPDPSAVQKRLATSGSGRQVWVDITANDRLIVIKRIGELAGVRWADLLKRREGGESWERLEREVRCSPEAFREGMARVYTFYETELNDTAARRGKLLP
jgi:hypothetical protein